MAEAPPTHENPRQVQDELRRVRLRPAGARDPGPTQREQHLCDHLSHRRRTSLPTASRKTVTATHTMTDRLLIDCE